MKTTYKDHEIEVKRETSIGGYETLYWSIIRKSDGYECDSGFEDSAETVNNVIANLKARVDAERSREDPWDEKEIMTAIKEFGSSQNNPGEETPEDFNFDEVKEDIYHILGFFAHARIEIDQLRQQNAKLTQLLNDARDDNDAALLAEIDRLRDELQIIEKNSHNHLGILKITGIARRALDPANSLVKDISIQTAQLREALRNLLSHVMMIGIAEGFPIEVQPDLDYPAFDIKATLLEAAAALGHDDQELRFAFPEMFKEEQPNV